MLIIGIPMRRTLSSLTVAAVLLTLVPGSALAAYSDVNGTRFVAAYDHLTARGMVQGYPDGTGRPTADINRAEAVKILLQARPEFVSKVNNYRSNPSQAFNDTGRGEWYDPYVSAAKEVGMLTGYPDGSFRPENRILLPEALGLIYRSYGFTAQAQSGQQWYQPYLDKALQQNTLFLGDQYGIAEPLTRGQFIDVVYRLEIVLDRNLSAFVDPPELANMQRYEINMNTGSQASGDPLVVRNNGMEYRQPGSAPAPTGSYDQSELQYKSSKEFAITIPRLGITDLSITHPEDASTSEGLVKPLQNGVGHLFAFPGNDGKVLVYGHSSGYAWDVSQYTKIFRRVNELKSGDRVYVTYAGKLFIYEVTGQQTINPSDVSPFMGNGEELILYTCWPPDSIATRLLVHARPIARI